MKSTINLDKVYHKLNALKTMAEGNYGNETKNAINIIEKLLKEYNIKDFYYTPFSEKKQSKKKSTSSNFDNSVFRTWRRTSFTSTMRDVLIDLINKMRLTASIDKGKIYVHATEAEWLRFSRNLRQVKREWKRQMNFAANAMYEFNHRFSI